MARYFFHVGDRQGTEADPDGIECSSFAAAERHAVQVLGTYLAESTDHFTEQFLSVEIVGEDGRAVSRVALTLSKNRIMAVPSA